MIGEQCCATPGFFKSKSLPQPLARILQSQVIRCISVGTESGWAFSRHLGEEVACGPPFDLSDKPVMNYDERIKRLIDEAESFDGLVDAMQEMLQLHQIETVKQRLSHPEKLAGAE